MRPTLPAAGLTMLAAILLAACTTTARPTMTDTDQNLQTSCDAEAAKPEVVGQTATPEVIQRARTAAGARVVRVIKPGQMVTMEYMEGRLNIDVDDSNVIVNLRCG
ncbi:MAG: I78 family peptidase inhibitor [Pseudomonadota bacterium]|nr:I78 family peptidase inhibitor [Pseudomonadota bacterium]